MNRETTSFSTLFVKGKKDDNYEIDKKDSPPAEKRIDVIDAVRGFAILGVLLVSINVFGRPGQYALNYTLDSETGINYYVWWITNGLFAGSMRALFSILFGASTILLLVRLEKTPRQISPADIYYRRMLILLGFAFVNGFIFLWYSDILYSYAICGLFLFPFRNMKSRYLLAIGLILLLVPAIKNSYVMHKVKEARLLTEHVNKEILAANQPKPGTATENNIAAKKQLAEEEKKDMLKGYASIFKANFSKTVDAQSGHFYSVGFLDVMPFFFFGMVLFKLQVLTGKRSKRFYWCLTTAGFGIGILIAWHMLRGYINAGFDSERYADYLVMDLYPVKRLSLALGFIGLIMLLYKYKLVTRLFTILAKVGQMTLTNYMMQAAICAVIFYGFGAGLFGSLERYQLYYVVLGVWIFQVAFSNMWMKHFRYGPVEWLWRSLTYWKIQPISR